MVNNSLIAFSLVFCLNSANNAFAQELSPPDLSQSFFADAPDPSEEGPYRYSIVTSGLSSSAYRSAMVYLPEGEGPFPATTLCGGYTNTKEDMTWLGELLASHGIITVIFTPTNPYSFSASTWAAGHVGSTLTLERENASLASELYGKVKVDKFALMGYSYGGAGSILAAAQLGDRTAAVVPLNPYNPTVLSVDAPILFVAGTRDTVARPALSLAAFNSIPALDQAKAFANIKNADHYSPLNNSPFHKAISGLAVPWLKVFLEGDGRYETYFNGEKIDQVVEEGNIFAKATDYIFIDNSR